MSLMSLPVIPLMVARKKTVVKIKVLGIFEEMVIDVLKKKKTPKHNNFSFRTDIFSILCKLSIT